MTTFKGTGVGVIVVLLAASVSGTGIGAAPPAGRDQVVIVFTTEPLHLSPLHVEAFDNGGQVIGPAIFMNDVEWDAAWRPFPRGVEFLPSVRDGTWKGQGERMTLRWRLRPRNWHDGRPVTCGDYVFALRLIRDERTLSSGRARGLSNGISGISCPAGAAGRDVQVDWHRRDPFANMAVLPTGRSPDTCLKRSTGRIHPGSERRSASIPA